MSSIQEINPVLKLSLEDNCIIIQCEGKEILRNGEFNHASLTKNGVLRIDGISSKIHVIPCDQIPINCRQLMFTNSSDEIVVFNCKKIKSIEINTNSFPIKIAHNFEIGDTLFLYADSLQLLQQMMQLTLDATWRKNTNEMVHMYTLSFTNE